MSGTTFVAPTLGDAFRRVRDRLGEEAVILGIRRSERGVEVEAARERPGPRLRRLLEGEEPVPVAASRPRRPRLVPDDVGALAGVDDPRAPKLRVLAGPGRSGLAGALTALELPPDLAAKLTTIGGRGADPWIRVHAWLERAHPIAVPTGSTRPMTLGFLGGRGTGRTTLVRGLAARAAVEEPGRVVWLQVGFPARPQWPIDDLMAPLGVDHRIANHPSEIEPVAREHGDVSVVLVDLPGIDLHSDGERRALARYQRACKAAWPTVEFHGVVPATWSGREAVRALTRQRALGIRGVAWTWMDRVADPGTLLTATLRSDLPPSFVHGDREGEGASSRVADWAWIVDRLRECARPEGS
jgi:hypothetical protein